MESVIMVLCFVAGVILGAGSAYQGAKYGFEKRMRELIDHLQIRR